MGKKKSWFLANLVQFELFTISRKFPAGPGGNPAGPENSCLKHMPPVKFAGNPASPAKDLEKKIEKIFIFRFSKNGVITSIFRIFSTSNLPP